MVLSIKLEVRGITRLRNKLGQFINNLPAIMNKGTQKLAKMIETQAKENLLSNMRYPRHTPGLISGTKALTRRKSGKTEIWEVTSSAKDEKGNEYSHLVEFGTGAHSIPNAFGKKGFTIKHPGSNAPTRGYFSIATNLAIQHQRGVYNRKLKQAITKSGL